MSAAASPAPVVASLPSTPVALLGAGVAAAFAVLLPLATYSLSLAAFGLAHVLTELRFVDGRFGDRVGARLRWGLLGLLACVVALRLGRLSGVIPGGIGTTLELALVGGLVALVLPALPDGARALGAAALLALGAGIVFAPVPTLLLLAVLHNWTPVGFLAEATRGGERRRVMALCALIFLAVPALIASGLPGAALSGLVSPDASLLPTGPLAHHLGAYLPAGLRSSGAAVPLFSAIVFAQCMHYATVIHVLPRLESRPSPGPLARLPWRGFMAAVVLLSALLLASFFVDFGRARSLYGVVAAVHAWVELPLLLLAIPSLGGAR